MDCCLTAPSYYLNQYWPIIIKVTWGQFHWECSRYHYSKFVVKLHIQNHPHISQWIMSQRHCVQMRWIMLTQPLNCFMKSLTVKPWILRNIIFVPRWVGSDISGIAAFPVHLCTLDTFRSRQWYSAFYIIDNSHVNAPWKRLFNNFTLNE